MIKSSSILNKIILLLIVNFLAISIMYAQERNVSNAINIEGQACITTSGDALFFSVGGAVLKLNFPKFTIAFIAMPVLKFKDDATKPFITPGFGAGPQLYFLKHKRFFLSAPFYYNSSKSKWQFTGGIGYIFTKPKSQ